MLNKADNSFSFAIAAALVLFFLGGILTTVVPPMVDKSWGRPFENHDPAKARPASCSRTPRSS
jgi:cytochrome c oxidase cbb3-type subunit II